MQFRENALMLHCSCKNSRDPSTPRPRGFSGYGLPRRSGRDDRALVVLVVNGGLVALRLKEDRVIAVIGVAPLGLASYARYPGLTAWANSCRASGAGFR